MTTTTACTGCGGALLPTDNAGHCPLCGLDGPPEFRRDRYGFPIESCSRCGGSGRYSWCQAYLDRCFRCSGSGIAIARGAAKAHAAWLAAIKAAREVQARDVGASDTVEPTYGTIPLGMGQSLSTPRGETRTVGSAHWVETPDRGARVTLCFTDGTAWEGDERTIWFRNPRLPVDRAAFIAAAERGVRFVRVRR